MTLEFALIFPLALLVISFITALGLRSLFAAATEYVTRDVARQGSIRIVDNDPTTDRYLDEAALQAAVRTRLNGVLSQATVQRIPTPNNPARPNGEGDLLTVIVTAPVPGVSALQGLAAPLGLTFLTEVTQRVTVRFE